MRKRIITLLICIAMLTSIVVLVACGSEDNEEWKNDMYLKLVNKENPVGREYVPENVISVNKSYTNGGKDVMLDKTVADKVIEMLDAMKADGITNVTVTSGYRTYDYQKMLFDSYCAAEKGDNPSWSDEEVKNQVLTYSAYPGTSEHQTGLCVDLITDEMVGLWNYGSETTKNPYDKGFAETAAFEWLSEHAHEYGFILRFPENKTDITGYSYESWHYRYVGKDHAEEIHLKGLTLEEYLNGNGK